MLGASGRHSHEFVGEANSIRKGSTERLHCGATPPITSILSQQSQFGAGFNSQQAIGLGAPTREQAFAESPADTIPTTAKKAIPRSFKRRRMVAMNVSLDRRERRDSRTNFNVRYSERKGNP